MEEEPEEILQPDPSEVLDALECGEITAEEAIEQLKGILPQFS